MVNNFLNVNKTNKHLSPQIIEQKIKTMTYDNGNSCLGLVQTGTNFYFKDWVCKVDLRKFSKFGLENYVLISNGNWSVG
jgi:hypothetical protein